MRKVIVCFNPGIISMRTKDSYTDAETKVTQIKNHWTSIGDIIMKYFYIPYILLWNSKIFIGSFLSCDNVGREKETNNGLLWRRWFWDGSLIWAQIIRIHIPPKSSNSLIESPRIHIGLSCMSYHLRPFYYLCLGFWKSQRMFLVNFENIMKWNT